jgi:hypothetical protein
MNGSLCVALLRNKAKQRNAKTRKRAVAGKMGFTEQNGIKTQNYSGKNYIFI